MPGDTCVGGGEWEAPLIACPSSWFGSAGSIIGKLMFVLLVLIVVALIVVAVLVKFDMIDKLLTIYDSARSGMSNFRHAYGIVGQSQPQVVVDDDAFYLDDDDSVTTAGHNNNNNYKREAVPLGESDVDAVRKMNASTTSTTTATSTTTTSSGFTSLPIIRTATKVPILPGPSQ